MHNAQRLLGQLPYSNAKLVAFWYGWMAEWSCSGLQLRVRRFDSDSSLHTSPSIILVSYICSPNGEIGRRKRLKISRPLGRAGSIPASGTMPLFKLQPPLLYSSLSPQYLVRANLRRLSVVSSYLPVSACTYQSITASDKRPRCSFIIAKPSLLLAKSEA